MEAAKGAEAKRFAEAAEAARLAEQPELLAREAVLIANASDAAQAKVAAKRGWLAYYAHLSLSRRLRESALSWPALSAERTKCLNLIEGINSNYHLQWRLRSDHGRGSRLSPIECENMNTHTTHVWYE